jgi:hypothetical protein
LRAAVDEIAGRGQAGSVGAGRGESDSSGRARRSENTNDAGPLGLVLPQAHAEHALGFAGSYLLFYAVSLVGVIPRCTVLLASHALPQAHASQAVTGFWDLWQSCADPANAFSDFSSRGIVYKVLVGSDHVLFGLGMMLACVAILYLTFPEACKSRRGAWRLGTSAALLFLLWALYFVGVLWTLLADNNITPAALDGLDWMRPLFAVVTFASTHVGYVYVATTFSSNIWQCCMNRCPGARSVVRSVFWRKICAVVAVAGTFTFLARITAVLYFFEALFESRISSVVAASGLCRGLNFLVRWLVNRDTSLPVHIANVFSMLLLSYVSVTIRKIILYQSQNLSALLVNCLTLASVEVVSRSLTYSCQIIMLGFRMQHLNTRTLGELVDLMMIRAFKPGPPSPFNFPS